MIYFVQKPPTGNITSDNVKLALSNLGLGYDAWCSFVEEAINASSKIESVMDNVSCESGYNQVAFVQKYFSQHWTGNGMKTSAYGPSNAIILVSLDSFLAKAAEIKKVFLEAQNSPPIGHPGAGTFTIQHPGEAGQEADAKKGVAKLMLLCL